MAQAHAMPFWLFGMARLGAEEGKDAPPRTLPRLWALENMDEEMTSAAELVSILDDALAEAKQKQWPLLSFNVNTVESIRALLAAAPPREPTDDMIQAAWSVRRTAGWESADLWRAMYDAAGKAATPATETDGRPGCAVGPDRAAGSAADPQSLIADLNRALDPNNTDCTGFNRTLIERCHDALAALDEEGTLLVAGITDMQERIAALKPDAERYRWLRKHPVWQVSELPNELELLDARIDAARTESAAGSIARHPPITTVTGSAADPHAGLIAEIDAYAARYPNTFPASEDERLLQRARDALAEQAQELAASREREGRLLHDGKSWTETGAIVVRLERELAEARKDAERYRWLRGNHRSGSRHQLVWFLPQTESLDADGLDAAIDAALAAQPERES